MLPMNPKAMKRVNMANIRRVLLGGGAATRAELAQAISVSTTTVRSLLAEMCQNGEITAIGQGASGGGRPAERYCLNPACRRGFVFMAAEPTVRYASVNLLGEVAETGELTAPEGELEAQLIDFIREAAKECPVHWACLGVAGIVSPGGYLKMDRHNVLKKVTIGAEIAAQCGIGVTLENDVNAITVGAGRCHARLFPNEGPKRLSMAYIHFNTGCVSAGLLSEGRLIRGYSNFAGELGLMPAGGGQSVEKHLQHAENLHQAADIVATLIARLNCVLNPRYVTLGGPGISREALAPVSKALAGLCPANLMPELLYSDDIWHDYREGLASLCAQAMLEDMQNGEDNA